jgi:preprotein translocase subunit YajC
VLLENKILETLATQGPFVVLFVYLLFYVLKQNATREGRYQETITKLADRLAVVEDIKESLGEIKAKIGG